MRFCFRSSRLRPPRPRRDQGRRLGGCRFRRLLLGFLLVGCRSTLDPASGDPRLDLQHADPRVRIRAAEQAVRASRMDLCALLVENLADRDGAVRLFTSIALRKLTGRDLGYKPHGTPLERQESIGRWREWLESEGLLARDAPTPESSAAEAPPDAPVPADESLPDSGIQAPPEAGGDLPPALPPVSPSAPLDSAGEDPTGHPTGHLAEHPVGRRALREKKSAEKADDRWVGASSEGR